MYIFFESSFRLWWSCTSYVTLEIRHPQYWFVVMCVDYKWKCMVILDECLFCIDQCVYPFENTMWALLVNRKC